MQNNNALLIKSYPFHTYEWALKSHITFFGTPIVRKISCLNSIEIIDPHPAAIKNKNSLRKGISVGSA